MLRLLFFLFAAVTIAAVGTSPANSVCPGTFRAEEQEDCPVASDDPILLQIASTQTPAAIHPVAEAKEQAVPLAPLIAQSSVLTVRINAESDARARLSLARPLVWLHVPKSGTAMVNLFYNHPGICPEAPNGTRLPQNTTIPDMWLFKKYPPGKYCRGSFPRNRPLTVQARHYAFGPVFDTYKGHVVAMFRQPEQRLMSDYYDIHWRQAHSWKRSAPPPRDARHFAEESQGCATKMLARGGDAGQQPCLGPGSPPPSEGESVLALKRLWEGFAFVGLTDEWELSVCLFHAKFAGDCKAAEFSEVRLGVKRNSTHSGYDTTELRGFLDEMDGKLYKEATRIFKADLARYHVSEERCAEWCWPEKAH